MRTKYLQMYQEQKWFFSDQKKKYGLHNLKVKLNGKWLYESKSVKYLGISIH